MSQVAYHARSCNNCSIHNNGVHIWSDHRSDFDEPTCIQIKFPYVFMSCFPHMVQNITMKGERSLAVRTYPNVVQILRVHILLPCCNAAANFI
jgi:hypothetical protein